MLTLLKKYFPLLSGKLGTYLLGLLAVALLVWVLGPQLGLHSTKARLLSIIAILALIAIVAFYRWQQAKMRGEKLSEGIQAEQESMAGRQLEIAVLKEKMNEAIESLKTSNLGLKYRGKAALYALPWYILIGPSAAGKSTILRNSGLNFPFSSSEDLHVKGFGGTRNCDWWFSDEAILLDTAGRYTTEDQDQAEWLGFLALLKRVRRRQAINGVMVALSLSDLLTADEKGLEWHVKVVRNRIAELNRELGYTFPVFLIITKCDLLKGFEEFFADYNQQELEQAWGITSIKSMNSGDFKVVFNRELEALKANLFGQRLCKLAIEQNLDKKQIIYHFPEQFSQVLQALKKFVDKLCEENPYQAAPRICGLYFTSAEQEQNQQAKLSLDQQQQFHVRGQQEMKLSLKPKGYFIKELLNKVIFANHDLSLQSEKRVILQRAMKSGFIVASGIVVLLFILSFSASFTSNSLLLRHGTAVASDLAAHLEQNDQTVLTQMNALNEAYSYYQSLQENKANLPLHLRMGLYRGNDLLNPLANMMASVMDKDFLQPVAALLVQRLHNYSAQWQMADDATRDKLRGQYYIALKDYLMLAYPARIDLTAAPVNLAQYWNETALGQQYLAENPAQQILQTENLQGLVRIYLAQLKQKAQLDHYLTTVSPDLALIAKARQQLYLSSDAKNLFAAVQARGLAKLQALSVNDLVQGNEANLLTSSKSLPGMYTLAAWNNYMQADIKHVVMQARDGDWVIQGDLGSLNKSKVTYLNSGSANQQDSQLLLQQVDQAYFVAYNAAWLNFLSSVSVQRFVSLDDAAQKLKILADPKGPMTSLLKVVMLNTKLPDPYAKADYASAADIPLQNISQLISGHPQANGLGGYFHEISTLQQDVKRLAVSPDVSVQARYYAQQLLTGGGANLELYRSSVSTEMFLENISDPGVRTALSSVLLAPTKEAWRAVVNQAAMGVQAQWQAQVMPVYQQVIQGKFPFASGDSEANITDVANFFRPKDGVLWNFVAQNLSAYLTFQQQRWTTKKWLGVGASFSKRFLDQLTQAQNISNSLFRNGEVNAQFNFELYPMPTPGLSQIVLHVGNQTYRYYNGPQQWHTFHWSSNAFNQETRLNVVSIDNDQVSAYEYDGVWGLFRLFAKAKVQQVNNQAYQLSWQLKSYDGHYYDVRFLTRANDNHSVIENIIIKHFALPAELFV